MSSKIRVLNEETINKMAAGEVIENPASVIKELIENSLDAQATQICVEIQEGGRQLIRVWDDGHGMSCDDALLCLERHATSKIREVEDIQEIFTMGFRGEALPSIAAISKLSLLTCQRSEEDSKAEKGTLILVEGGHLVSSSSAARSPGTTIEVKSLFFNVPVRRKFQKSPSFDVQEILRIMGLLALAYPAVHFELISDQKLLLKTPLFPSEISFHDLLEKRLECVLGKDYASNLLPLKFQQRPYGLEGFIGSPLIHKPNRMGQHLFINQRSVTSPLIGSAIREGYGTMLPNHRYPLFVLHLRMPGSLLDVNVHPQKKEVRLRQEYILKEAIVQAVQTALRQDQKPEGPDLATTAYFEKSHLDEINSPVPPFWAPYASLLSSNSSSPKTEENWEFRATKHSFGVPMACESPTMLEQEIKIASPSFEQNFQFEPPPKDLQKPLLPLVHGTPRVLATIVDYCILNPFELNPQLFCYSKDNLQEGGLCLLDQRAAYRRIYYERLRKSSSTQDSQSLLIPFTLEMKPSEVLFIREFIPFFNQMGFGLREFGENTFMIDSFPAFLKENQLHHCLNMILQDLIETETSQRLSMQKEEYLALAACRASLPSSKQLSIEEAQGLAHELMKCEMISQCPFGKPVCFYLSPEELGKWFLKSFQERIKSKSIK